MSATNLLPTDPDQLWALFSWIPDRKHKPAIWEQRIERWTQLIEGSGRQLGTFLVAGPQAVRDRFRLADGFAPQLDGCIDVVLEEMRQRGLLLPAGRVGDASSQKQQQQRQAWLGWLAGQLLPSWLLSSSAHAAAPSVGAASQPLVLTRQLEEEAARLEREFSGEPPMFVDELLLAAAPLRRRRSPPSAAAAAAAAATPSSSACESSAASLSAPPSSPAAAAAAVSEEEELELELLLRHLAGRGRLHRAEPVEGRPAVKFGSEPMSEVERSVLLLRHSEQRLGRMADALRASIAQCTAAATRCYRVLHDKAGALRQLRRRKRLEAVLEQREAARDNLHTLLLRIESTQADRQVLEAYQLGAATLRLARGELSEEQVHDVLEQVADALAEQDAIDAALAGGPVAAGTEGGVEDDEQRRQLEDELAEIEAQLVAEALPSVPQAHPEPTPSTVDDELPSMLQNLRITKQPLSS